MRSRNHSSEEPLLAPIRIVKIAVGFDIILDFHERECLAMTLPFPQLELTEALADVAVAARAVDRNERADRVRAERLCKGDFLFRSGPRNCHVRCAEPIDKLSGKELDQHLAIVLG